MKHPKIARNNSFQHHNFISIFSSCSVYPSARKLEKWQFQMTKQVWCNMDGGSGSLCSFWWRMRNREWASVSYMDKKKLPWELASKFPRNARDCASSNEGGEKCEGILSPRTSGKGWDENFPRGKRGIFDQIRLPLFARDLNLIATRKFTGPVGLMNRVLGSTKCFQTDVAWLHLHQLCKFSSTNTWPNSVSLTLPELVSFEDLLDINWSSFRLVGHLLKYVVWGEVFIQFVLITLLKVCAEFPLKVEQMEPWLSCSIHYNLRQWLSCEVGGHLIMHSLISPSEYPLQHFNGFS